MHGKIGEMAMATVRMEKHVQTICRLAAAVDFADETARLTANCRETIGVAVAAVGEIARRVHWQEES
jgi:hypothetical protein